METDETDGPLAMAAFFVPVEPERQEIARFPHKSQGQPSQVVSVTSVKVLAAARAPVIPTGQRKQAPARHHMKVDVKKNPHKILKPNVWAQHMQKEWGDPNAHQGKRGESITGASEGLIPYDPWDVDGQKGKKARRESSEQFSMSRKSDEIYERVPSRTVRAQTQQGMEAAAQAAAKAQAAVQKSVTGWLEGQPRDRRQ
ncbi:MAG: hypothetical protein GY835_23715, partial [bacterium]|nr:hypothetical protein [bacterium]